MLLTQTDKIILSKMLSLELFAYYTLAWALAAILMRIIDPIESGVYPTLTRLVAQANESELSRIYHKSCQMQIVLLVPAALILILFGDWVLMIWSGGDAELSRNAAPILSILAVGTCLNGFMHMPYLIQLAHGWTSLAFYQNVISVVVIVPMMVLLTQMYQGVGAAYVWLFLNAGYVIISIQIMHRRILKEEKWNWYILDVGWPTAAAFSVVAIVRWIMPFPTSEFAMIAYVSIAGCSAFFAAAMAASFVRTGLLRKTASTWRHCLKRSSLNIG